MHSLPPLMLLCFIDPLTGLSLSFCDTGGRRNDVV
jgi:hypothetical protein